MTDALGDVQRDASDEGSVVNVVRYLGVVTERHITREEWEQAGVSDQDGVVWTRDTGYIVPIGRFSATALDMIGAMSSEFQVVREG
jgi:hypothetical protein